MSHFAVLVATKTAHKGELNDLLAPYHEYECTSEQDRYVQAHSELSTYQDGYAQDTVNMAKRATNLKTFMKAISSFALLSQKSLKRLTRALKPTALPVKCLPS